MTDVNHTAVVLRTRQYVIHGELNLVEGARVTDFLREAEDFIVVTKAVVHDHNGDEVARVPFCDVATNTIEIAYLMSDEV